MINSKNGEVFVNVKEAIKMDQCEVSNLIQKEIYKNLKENAEKLEDLLFYSGEISFTNITPYLLPDEAPKSMDVQEYFLNNEKAEEEQKFIESLDFKRNSNVELDIVRKIISKQYPILNSKNIETMIDYANNAWPLKNVTPETWILNMSNLAKMTAEVKEASGEK